MRVCCTRAHTDCIWHRRYVRVRVRVCVCGAAQVDGVPRAAMDELYKRPSNDVREAIAARQSEASALVEEAGDIALIQSLLPSIAETDEQESPMNQLREEAKTGSKKLLAVDPDEVLGDDGYLLPGEFINLVRPPSL